MKKLIALILTALLLLSAACAEDWQDKLAEYSLEELQTMAAAYSAEIIRRTTESFEIPTGTYVVGEDFPAGTYRLERMKNSATVKIWKDAKAATDEFGYFFLEGLYSDDPVIGKLKLEAGNIIEIGAAVKFSLYKGVVSW